MSTRDFSGVKAAGAWGWRPTTLVVPNVKKSGALTCPDPLGPSRWPVVGETFTFSTITTTLSVSSTYFQVGAYQQHVIWRIHCCLAYVIYNTLRSLQIYYCHVDFLHVSIFSSKQICLIFFTSFFLSHFNLHKIYLYFSILHFHENNNFLKSYSTLSYLATDFTWSLTWYEFSFTIYILIHLPSEMIPYVLLPF